VVKDATASRVRAYVVEVYNSRAAYNAPQAEHVRVLAYTAEDAVFQVELENAKHSPRSRYVMCVRPAGTAKVVTRG